MNVTLNLNTASRLTWNVGTGFAVSNPSSTGWTYGYLRFLNSVGDFVGSSGYNFGAFANGLQTSFHASPGMEGYADAATPYIAYNTTSSNITLDEAYTVLTNQVVLTAKDPQDANTGFNESYAAVTWTSPPVAAYNVSWQFQNLGNNGNAAKIMAITTNNSINVKPAMGRYHGIQCHHRSGDAGPTGSAQWSRDR